MFYYYLIQFFLSFRWQFRFILFFEHIKIFPYLNFFIKIFICCHKRNSLCSFLFFIFFLKCRIFINQIFTNSNLLLYLVWIFFYLKVKIYIFWIYFLINLFHLIIRFITNWNIWCLFKWKRFWMMILIIQILIFRQ